MQKPRIRLIAKILAVAALGLFPSNSSIGSDASVAYTYDAAGRLISASYANGLCVIYTYDINGNRLSEATGAPSTAGTGMWGCFSWNSANWGS